MNLISIERMTEPVQGTIKIRYNDGGHPGEIIPEDTGRLRIRFDQPQAAITPGQSAVFFDDDTVIGGGIIKTRITSN